MGPPPVKTAVLIVAAGRGTRAGPGAVPKQYRSLSGRSVLGRSLDAFAGIEGIGAVRVVIHPDDRLLYEAAVRDLGDRLLEPVAGGATRQLSVLNGLESLTHRAPDHVLIHDAARPFVDRGTICRVMTALQTHEGAIAALPLADTLKREAQGPVIAETVARNGLWQAQTPQGFRFTEILAAHRAAAGAGRDDFTDDAAVAEAAGMAVALVMGSPGNRKLTTEEDVLMAERLLAAEAHAGPFEYRTGTGLDVHRFGPGDHVVLCGLAVPHTSGLVGHSDADAPLHALTDAILGTIGAGDIGQHFPPSDPRWKGASSDRFVRHALELLAQKGGTLVHADITIVCEAPRIGPHREAMATGLAALLGLSRDRVSIKATTSEGLGFTGRGEGLMAMAAASVRLPLLA